jgi:hypothetical protein
LTLVGHRPMIEGLQQMLNSACGVPPGPITPSGRSKLWQITLSKADSARVLEQAYRQAPRSSPRAVKFVERFQRAAAGRSKASS